MFTKIFWKDAIERAIRTFAQGFLSITTLDSTGAMSSNWKQALLAGGVAAILSIVMSLASSTKGTSSASFVVDTKELRG